MSTSSKRAFITGVYGQDGSYLAEYLLAHGYEVLGLMTESDTKSPNAKLLEGRDGFTSISADLRDTERISGYLNEFSPHEIYNIAAVSDLKTAKEQPEYTYEVNYTAFKNLVEKAITQDATVKIFQALSSRILVPDENGSITEASPLAEPLNAYDRAKRDSYSLIQSHRKNGFFIASGILCNHESPRRGNRFVTGKIAQTVACISKGEEKILSIGNIFAKRDWSFAGDVVRAIHAIMHVAEPQDYVIGSGVLHTVKDLIDVAFGTTGMQITWEGEGMLVRGYDDSGELRVAVNPDFYQQDDNPVVANIELIQRETGWYPETSFETLISMMVNAELQK